MVLEWLCLQFRKQRPDWEIEIAHNGNQALARMRDTEFDLVVTDILMPDGDGIETMTAMRRAMCHTPVVAISGGSTQVGCQILDVARHLGAFAVLAKPFSFDELLTIAASVLDDGEPGA